MKCKQRFLAGILAAVMTVYAGVGSGLGVIAEQDGLTAAEVSGEEVPSYLTYQKIGNHISIKGGSDKTITSVSIPSQIDGIPVTSIADFAFADYENLQEVNIPDTVTTIGQQAFKGCKSLEKISLPDSLATIHQDAFANSGLTEITIPKSVTNMAEDVFRNCQSLSKVTICGDIKMMSAFVGCSALTEVILPEGLTTIGNAAFSNCTGLTRIQIPSSVKRIEDKAFYGCIGLTEIELPEGLERIGTAAFDDCASLQRIFLPTTLTELGMPVFSENTEVLVKKSETLAEPLRETDSSCSLNIVEYPKKTEYLTGESLDLAGMRVDAVQEIIYNDTIVSSFTKVNVYHFNLSITGYDKTVAGEQEVTLTYAYDRFSASASFPVTVIQTYTVTYDANGGSGAPESQIKIYDSNLTLADTIPQLPHHRFIGWAVSPDGAVEYGAGDEFAVNADTTLYAVWEALPTYTITYCFNDGTRGMTTQTIWADEEYVEIEGGVPPKQNMASVGWSFRPNGTVYVKSGSVICNPGHSITLYAVWNQYCTNCSTGTKTISCTYCDKGVASETIRSCRVCSGSGKITETITEVQTEIIPCVMCVDGKYWSDMFGGYITCTVCDGYGIYKKETPITSSKTYSCNDCGGDGKIVDVESCTYCGGDGYSTINCPQCDGERLIGTTATLNGTEYYTYEVNTDSSQFFFSHDRESSLITSISRYTFDAYNRQQGEAETLTDSSALIVKGDTPAEQFSGQSGLHDLVFKCTDKYGTMEIPAAASAYIGVKGDANTDGVVNAADAASILVYAAECGASGEAVLCSDTDETLERFAYFLADIDGESMDGGTDSPLNAADAAAVLVYAAAQGSGSNITWEELYERAE